MTQLKQLDAHFWFENPQQATVQLEGYGDNASTPGYGSPIMIEQREDGIGGHVETLLRNHYQGLVVSVRSARRVPGKGVEIRGIRIAEAGDANAPVLAQIDEIFGECDTRLPDFLTRPPQFTSVHIHRLKLRAERKSSGVWNLSYLLPLPPSQGSKLPVATITDGAIEFKVTLITPAVPEPARPIVTEPLCVAVSPGTNFVETVNVDVLLPDAGDTRSHG